MSNRTTQTTAGRTLVRLATVALGSGLAACAAAPSQPLDAEGSAPDLASFRDSPFARFFGTWTLQDDKFEQVWDTSTLGTLTIPKHLTQFAPVNTTKSVLCVVNAGSLRGRILWAFDDASTELRHLSHFGSSRLGTGSGTL